MAEKLQSLSASPTYRAIKAASKNDYFDICQSQRNNDIAQLAAVPLLVVPLHNVCCARNYARNVPRKDLHLL
jgi:hypothetical protein